ncbi:MAG: LacI family DNA-binding transcriptional regulator [Clostridia bacterium]|nr:LacI family DNA-binding transcriptional regulator [Clostridia bacterium]
MSITLKDIAQELNISINAVSRALRNMPDIGPDTTKLVHETAQRMGYRKNLAASYLKTARSMTLGIIVPDVCNPVFSHMYRGVEKICGNMGYTLMLANSSERPDKESAQLDSMIARGIDGVFIVPSIQNSALSKQLETAKIPYVLLQRKSSEHLSHFVQSDDFEGGYLAAKHLYTLGHRSFLLIFPSLLISSAQERYHGFLSYLRENGVSDSAVYVLECDGTRDSGYEAMHTWLAEHATRKKLHASAVFCFSDYVAAGVYSAIKKFGLHIPDDLSVIGYDNNEYSDIVFPPLTTIDILSYDIGKHAARLMLDILQSDKQDGSEAQTKVIISPQLIVRESTAKKA